MAERKANKLRYSVTVHTKKGGMEILEPIDGDSGDEAAANALKQKNDPTASCRSVQPYSEAN